MVDQLFPHFKPDKSQAVASYNPKDPESYEAHLHSMMDDAWDYETSILAGDRSAAQLLFYGLSPSLDYTDAAGPYRGVDPNATIGEILNSDEQDSPNRSTYVSTDVRDSIMLTLPSLIRLFGATETPVYFVPRSQAEVDQAEQVTDYVNYVFWNDNPGFLILYGAFKDAMTVKTGFVKWWTEDNVERRRKNFKNIGEDQLKLIQADNPDAKIIKLGKPVPPQAAAPQIAPIPGALPPPPPQAPGGQPPGAMGGAPAPPGLPMGPPAPPPIIYDSATIEYEVSKPLIRVCGVPPEEMRLDRYARSFKESRICGHERVVPVDQLVAMGVDRGLCLDNIQSNESNTFSVEPQLRNPGRFMGSSVADGCLYGEWYVKIDKDGDDTPELRYICTIGENREIITDEDANRLKFALFSVDPIAHTIVGDSLADYTDDVQRIKTNLMRVVLDSGAEATNPRTYINQLLVNVDDALNDDLGPVIRVNGDPNSAVLVSSTPFLGQQVMPLIDALNDQLARRTGLTDAAKGLDPKALQSSTEIGVEAVINGAQERVELMARVLCETGFKDLFEGLFNEVCENPNQKRTLKLRGKWTECDPSTFDESMTVEVNANLGKGSDMTRMIALQGIKQDQQLLVSQMGINNPICGIQEMLNTQTDILALANVKNVGRYFKTPNPEQMQALQSQPKTPDPMAVAAQAQLEKVRSESAQAVAKNQFDAQKLASDSALKREADQHKTALGIEKLRIDASKAHMDNSAKLGDINLKSQQAENDQRAADQDGQLRQQEMAQKERQGELDAQQKVHDANMKAAQLLSSHIQGMASTNSGHTQAMTQMATQHHQAMTGHAVKAADTVVGAMSSDADRIAGAQDSAADRQHASRESAADREHQAKTTAATLNTQKTIAKSKPKPKAKK